VWKKGPGLRVKKGGSVKGEKRARVKGGKKGEGVRVGKRERG
jgi:hypothetical protein